MGRPISIVRSGKGIVLTAFALPVGLDLSVIITGGPEVSPDDGAHVGCVCLGIPRGSLRNDGTRSATVSTLNVTGHKDDEIGALFARRLAALTGGVCSVTCGIHVDNATETDVEFVVRLAEKLLRELEDWIGGLGDERGR